MVSIAAAEVKKDVAECGVTERERERKKYSKKKNVIFLDKDPFIDS